MGNTETGGELYGLRGNDGRPVVMLSTGPGKEALHRVAHFEQDIDYVRECSRYLREQFGLDYLGRWHLHHSLGLDRPSWQDVRSGCSIKDKNGLPSMLEFILVYDKSGKAVNVRLHAYAYVTDEALPQTLKVLPGLSPVRELLMGSVVFPEREDYAWRFPAERVLCDAAPGNEKSMIDMPEALAEQVGLLSPRAQANLVITVDEASLVLEFPIAKDLACRVGYLVADPEEPVAIALLRDGDHEGEDVTDEINPCRLPLDLKRLCDRLLDLASPEARDVDVTTWGEETTAEPASGEQVVAPKSPSPPSAELESPVRRTIPHLCRGLFGRFMDLP